ncbi:MAG: PRC-barrel domain-containing protein [Ruminococcus callidus]
MCTLEELRCKDVINIVNGENLGRVDDLQMNANSATVTALILYGRPRFFEFWGRVTIASLIFGKSDWLEKMPFWWS